MPNKTAATLLFAHGGSFCKQIWDPIIRRLKESPIMQQVATEFVTFDFPFHGSKRDESVAPKLDMSTPTSPRVWHPAQDLVPFSTAEVQRQVQLTRPHWHRPLDGGGALWNAEVQDPGTFDVLILFEPVYGLEDPELSDKLTSFMVSATLQRETSWPSREKAVQHFENLKNFSYWDRESLAAYLEGALVEEDATGETVLACHPHIEASLYCHKLLHFTDDELKRPKCSVRFHYGGRSNVFFGSYFEDATEKCPDIYSLDTAMKNCTHLLVLEDPKTAGTKILSDLAKTALFRQDQQSRI